MLLSLLALSLAGAVAAALIHASVAGLEPSATLDVELRLPANDLVPLSDFDAEGLLK
jgi:hypothetical protein